MKKNVKVLLSLTFLYMLINTPFYAQDACGSNAKITTNPDNPVNEKDTYPHTRLNNFFDWRVEDIPIYCNAPYYQGYPYILSPFWDSDALYKDKVFKNYKPEDGWELMKIKRGYKDMTVLNAQNQPVSVPGSFSQNAQSLSPDPFLWFVLYNKYTALLRVFVAVADSRAYTGANMNIYFRTAHNNKLTNLLRSPDLNSPLIALDEIATINSLSVPIYYDNNPGRWLYADFQMMYDPCTCFYQSEIVIDIKMINDASITLNGIFDGTIVDIQDKFGGAGIVDDKNAYGLDALTEVTGKAYSAYNSVSGFVNNAKETLSKHKRKSAESVFEMDFSMFTDEEINEYLDNYPMYGLEYWYVEEIKEEESKVKSGLDNLLVDMADSDWLQAGLSAVPYIGAALTFADFFIGGGKKSAGPQLVKISPMAINAEMKLSGNIITDLPYDNITISTPGGNHTNIIAGPENTALYDQTLGVFNLLNTPSIMFYKNRTFNEVKLFDYPFTLWNLKCKDAFAFITPPKIDFVINPAAGFKTDTEDIDIMVSLVIEDQNSYKSYQVKREWYEGGQQCLFEMIKPRTFNEEPILFDVVKPNMIMTKYMPLDYFLNKTFILKSSEFIYMGLRHKPTDYNHHLLIPIPDFKFSLKIMVNLKRKDADEYTQNVLFTATYPVKYQEYNSFFEGWLMNDVMRGISKDLQLENITIEEDQFAWETITLNNVVFDFSSQNDYIIKAGEEIIVRPNAILSPGVSLELGLPFYPSVEKYGPETDVTSFCESNQVNGYKPELRNMERFNKLSMDNWIVDDYKLSIFPNPTSSKLNLRFSHPESTTLKLTISNVLGETLIIPINQDNYPAGEFSIPVDVSGLSPGVYYCTMQSPLGVISKSFVVIK